MNNKGQAGAWEGIIIVLLVIGMGALVYILFKKDSSIYQSGSNPTITDSKRTDWPFSIHIGEGGCAHAPVKTNRN